MPSGGGIQGFSSADHSVDSVGDRHDNALAEPIKSNATGHERQSTKWISERRKVKFGALNVRLTGADHHIAELWHIDGIIKTCGFQAKAGFGQAKSPIQIGNRGLGSKT